MSIDGEVHSVNVLERSEATQQPVDASGLPEAYGVDEVELLCRGPRQVFVYWEVTDAGLADARDHLRLAADQGMLVLRIFDTTLQHDGREQRDVHDVAIEDPVGSHYLDAPRPGSVARAAVGLLSAEGLFVPIAHSSPLHVPPEQPARETSAEWLNVQPVQGRGYERERIVARPDPSHQERGVPFGIRNREQKEDAGSERCWFDGPSHGKGSGGLAGAPAAPNASRE